ncbi:acyl transferase/acyl hydrolase/lysophospholipase [Rhizoctonia solani]|nr:acyl transferase/acyl hydrolase/lysophospholipase [Rhizoctonia solani]
MSSPETLKVFSLEFRPPATVDSSWDPRTKILLEARLDTKLLNKTFWSRLDGIQLKTKTTAEYRRATDGKILFTWFDISLHRPWESVGSYPAVKPSWWRSEKIPTTGPRANFTDGGSLRWRSHTNHPKAWHAGSEFGGQEFSKDLEFGGRIFTQRDELVKQLEFGDVVVVTLYARFEPGTIHHITGELVISLLNEEINRDLASYGRYRYWPNEPCKISSEDHGIQSEIWFSTPALDKNSCLKLDTVQLFTESQDQGYVSDPKTASYSWFDVVILSSPGDKDPRIHNGVALAWRSHSNTTGGEALEVLDGLVFDRSHDLLHLLEDGNAIGVRVSCRFGGWENRANDGCLELRFTSTDIARRSLEFESGQIEAVKLQQELADYLSNTQEGAEIAKTVELSPNTLNQLNTAITGDQVSSQEKPELTLLSLDGGGVRGLISLYMLKAIMDKIGQERAQEAPKPCQVFDLIIGTSTGGLIALMLGRLDMSADDCIKKYKELATGVFGTQEAKKPDTSFVKKLWHKAKNAAKQVATYTYIGSRYQAHLLKAAVRSVVKERDVNRNPDAMMWFNTIFKCRAIVLASRTANFNKAQATSFRTYSLQSDPNAPNCSIWEAARATSAAPTYFDSIKVGGIEYVDGGLKANNPVFQALIEGQKMPGGPRPLGCLISIGTGTPSARDLRNTEGMFGALKAAFGIMKESVTRLTDSEGVHDLMLPMSSQLGVPYYRFNPNTGGDIDLDDTSQMERFETIATEYLGTEDPQKWVAKCAEKLGRKLDRSNV